MTKKRTKKQKSNPNYSFLERAKNAPLITSSKPVNRQRGKNIGRVKNAFVSSKKARISEKDDAWSSHKKDIIKSFSFSALIISLELMLYFVWQ